MQSWFNMRKAIKVMLSTNGKKKKKHWQNSAFSHEEISWQTRNGRKLSQPDKRQIQKKSMSNILIYSEKWMFYS